MVTYENISLKLRDAAQDLSAMKLYISRQGEQTNREIDEIVSWSSRTIKSISTRLEHSTKQLSSLECENKRLRSSIDYFKSYINLHTLSRDAHSLKTENSQSHIEFNSRDTEGQSNSSSNLSYSKQEDSAGVSELNYNTNEDVKEFEIRDSSFSTGKTCFDSKYIKQQKSSFDNKSVLTKGDLQRIERETMEIQQRLLKLKQKGDSLMSIHNFDSEDKENHKSNSHNLSEFDSNTFMFKDLLASDVDLSSERA